MAQPVLTRDDILETLRAHRAHLASEFGVRRIGLFGSYAKGEQHEASDLDFLAELDKPLGLKFVDLASFLESLFGRHVDVLTPAGVQAIRNPRIATDIRETVVYA